MALPVLPARHGHRAPAATQCGVGITGRDMKFLIAGLAALGCMGAASAAQDTREAPVRDALTGAQIQAALAEAGLNPTLIKDKRTGDPVAAGTLPGGMIFVARGVECEGRPRSCAQVVLFANFDLGREVTDADFRVVNAFNDSSANGRAYVLETKSQIGVDTTIDLTGGVTDEHVGSKLTRWPAIVGDFFEEMRDSQPGS